MKRLLYVLIPAVILGGLIAWRFQQKTADKELQDQDGPGPQNGCAHA